MISDVVSDAEVTQAGSRFIAHFTPEAWVNDWAIEVDSEGEREWDCTAYATDPGVRFRNGGSCLDYLHQLLRRAQIAGNPDTWDMLDTDDVFKDDPGAPAWVREWRGPFTIRVRRVKS